MLRRTVRSLLNLGTALVVLSLLVVGLEWYLSAKELAERHRSCELYVESDLFLPSPSIHHTLRPGGNWRTPSSGEGFTINRLGLRGPEPAVPKPPGRFRVLLLGDESIFTPSLPQINTTAEKLRTLFAVKGSESVEVINGGVPGYCPLLSLLQYRDSLSSLQADLVVLHFSSNDIDDDYRYRGFLRSDQRSGRSVSVSHPILLDRCAVGRTTHSVTRLAIGRWFMQQVLATPDETKPKADGLNVSDSLRLRHSLQPIKELNELTNQLSSRLVVTSSPTNAELVAGKPTPQWRRVNQAVRAFARQHNIEFCDTATGYSEDSGGILVDQNHKPPASSTPKSRLAVQLANYLIQNVGQRTHGTIRRVGGSKPDQLPRAD